MIDIQKIKTFEALLKKSEKLLLINHIDMDPDAHGSLGAFYFVAKKLGKTVKAVNDYPAPKEFSFLGSNDIYSEDLDIKHYDPDLIISFDAASLDRLGQTYSEFESIFLDRDFVVFDHHMTNPEFGSLNFVYTEAASTCEIVFETLEKLGLTELIDEKIATLLTAGIHTDTNVFYNQNTRPETLEIAAKLMRYGADFRTSIFEFFQSFSYEKLRLYARVGEKIQAYKNKQVYGAIITASDFTETGASRDDTSGIINRLSNMKGAEVVFIIYEYEQEKKVSLRSKHYDIGSVAALFGGGGHKNAAGFNTTLPSEEIINKILESIDL